MQVVPQDDRREGPFEIVPARVCGPPRGTLGQSKALEQHTGRYELGFPQGTGMVPRNAAEQSGAQGFRLIERIEQRAVLDGHHGHAPGRHAPGQVGVLAVEGSLPNELRAKRRIVPCRGGWMHRWAG